MDRGIRDLPAIMPMTAGIISDRFPDCNGFKFQEPLPLPSFPFIDQNAMQEPPSLNPSPNPNVGLNHSVNPSPCPEEDSEIFSDIALKYISQMLMEEDMEEKSGTYQESLALQATEKSFYDVIGKKYPPSLDRSHQRYVDHYIEKPDDCLFGSYSNCNNGSGSSGLNGSCVSNVYEYPSSQSVITVSSDQTPQSSFCSSNSISRVVAWSEECTTTNLIQLSDLVGKNQHMWQFKIGAEEASKFLPNGNNGLILGIGSNGFLQREPKEEVSEFEVRVEEKGERDHMVGGSRGRKNPHRVDLDLEEGRSNKQSAVFSDGTVRSEMFDMVLLCGGKCGPLSTYREALQNGVSKNSQNSQSKGSNGGGKSRGKKQGKKEVVDLRTLLIHCAQAVSVDDSRNATELLKQIRQHSSPYGDGTQRLSHWFAKGLEARLAGTGSQIYTALASKRTTAADILKAYHLYLAACPFKKLSHFFATQTILNVAKTASRLHIVHFGIYFGFQWPCFFQRLSGRPGGPPKVRITGIDFPQPGFRPAERIEETGRRLADYARTFNVPFEYTPIARKWENIQVEDIKIEKDEVLVVHSLFRFKGLLDETVVVDSPRNIVLNTIRKMNPDVFIHGVVNGAYSAPFFVTRFREALFHWSALFDMLETNVPREDPERLHIERDLFAEEALNVIACEGLERVERPETYKQWQVRHMRAGLKQLPLNKEIMKKARDKVKNSYCKDFVIDEDSQWMLQGWKGRIIYALSTWKPDETYCES